MNSGGDGGFCGSIDDISVVDLMEILHFTRKSGVMLMRRGLDQAEIFFSRGNVVAASSTTVPQFISDHLVQAGAVDRATIRQALEVQSQAHKRRPIGSILLEMGAVDRDQLEQALSNLIGQIVRDAVAWDQGSIEFRLESTEVYRDLAADRDHWTLDVPIDTRELISNGLKLYNDRNRRNGEHGERTREFGDDISDRLNRVLGDGVCAHMHGVALFSPMPTFRTAFRAAAQAKDWVTYIHADVTEWTSHLRPAVADPGALSAAVIDLCRDCEEGESELATSLQFLAEEILPHVPVVPIFSPRDLVGQALAHALGFERVLVLPRPHPADGPEDRELMEGFLMVVCACLDAVLESRQTAGGREPVDKPGGLGGNWILEFIRHRSSASVSLSLLRFMAENAERSVLLLNRGRDLLAIGAFGATPDGETISSRLPQLTLPCSAKPLCGVVSGEGLFYGEPAEDLFSTRLFEVIGRPANPRVLLLPVTILERVALVAYCDNGLKKSSIEGSISSLEAISRYAGLVLENSLLRKKVKDKQLSR